MKNKYYSYLKFSFLILLTAQTKCFAAESYSDPMTYADRIKFNHTERANAFNEPEVYRTPAHEYTRKIDTILTNTRIVSTSRTASEDQAKTFLQSIMARVVIHGNENVYSSHGLESADRLFGHFEILRLTEQFSFKLYEQYSKGFVDTSCLSSEYQGLQRFNNSLSLEKFTTWFNDVLQSHNTGLYNRLLKRINTQSKHTDHNISELCGSYIVFNGIKITNIGRLLAMPYIDTYHPYAQQRGIHIRINDNTFISITRTTQAGGTPYTVRLHPYVMPDANTSTNQNVDVSTSIEMGKNKDRKGHFVDISIHDSSSVHIHPGGDGAIALSPDNKHLTNLPQEILRSGEAYSFVSNSQWSSGNVKVFHLVVGDYDTDQQYPYDGLYNFLTSNRHATYSDFLRHFANKAYNKEFSKHYAPHLRKLMTFLESLS